MARELLVRIVGDSSSLRREFERSSRSSRGFGRDIDKAARGAIAATVSFRGLGRALAFSSSAFLGGAGAVAAAKATSEAASNLAEQTSKTERVFGSATRTVERFAADALGLARDQALETASTFGALLRPIGLTGDAAAKLSVKLTQLGTDLSSFFNTDTADALLAIRSGLVGEVEPLRRYGVLLSEARVQQEALRETGKKTASQLTAQEKVLARVSIILQDTKQAAGDYQRTIGGLANQQREFQKNTRNLEIAIGQALNPSILNVTKSLNRWLGDSRNVAAAQREVKQAVGVAVDAAKGLADAARTLRTALEPVVALVGGTRSAVRGLAIAVAAVKLSRLIGDFRGIALAAGEEGAAGRVALLRTRLLSLRTIGPISIAIALDLLKSHFDEQVRQNRARVPPDLTRAGVSFHKSSLISGGSPTGFFIPESPDTPAVLRFIGRTVREARRKLIAEGLLAPSRQGQFPFGGATPRGTLDFAATARVVRRAVEQGARDAKPQPISLAARFNIAELQLAQAQLTRSLADDRRILVTERAILQAQVASAKTLAQKTQLTKTLASVTDQIRGIDQQAAEAAKQAADAARERTRQLREQARQAAEAAKAALQTRQFRLLGLGPTGEQLAPTVRALRAELGKVGGALEGTFLDTRKTQSILSRVRRLLSGGLGQLGAEVRSKVKEILDDLDQQLKDHTTGPATRFQKANTARLLAGLGLDPNQVRALRARLSQLGAGGTIPRTGFAGAFGVAVPAGTTIVHTRVELDGREVGRSVTRHQQRDRRRNPDQRRGMFAGGV